MPTQDQLAAPTIQKKKLTLSFENYKQISNMLILHIRNEESRAEAGGEVSTSSDGLKRSDIVNWYLQECADDIESEEDLIERKSLAEKVLDRLCYHVSFCFSEWWEFVLTPPFLLPGQSGYSPAIRRPS